MPLLYGVVARGTVVLAEYSVVAGNASTIARRILEKSGTSGDNRISYTQDRHVFHILRSEGLTFLCVADAQFGRRIPFAFLDDIQMRFLKTYGRIAQTALAYAMNDEFSRVLAQQLEYFSNNPNSDAINRVRGEIGEMKAVMMENIDKVLDRGDRIGLLVDKTNGLNSTAIGFKKQARALKRALWWKNAKLMVALSVIIVIVLYLIISAACGGLTLPSCR